MYIWASTPSPRPGPERYDELVAIHGAAEMGRLGYVRVHPAFRVIAPRGPFGPLEALPPSSHTVRRYFD